MKPLPILLAGLVFVAAIAVATVGISAGETPKKLRIIYTSDLSGYIEPCG